MKSRVALAVIVALWLQTLLLGCSSNECGDNSVCGDRNAENNNGSGVPAPEVSGLPFAFTVKENDPWDACDGGFGRVFLKPTSLDDIAPHLHSHESGQVTSKQLEVESKDLAAFDRKHGAVAAELATIDVTLQGRSTHAVTIQDITVDVADVSVTPKTSIQVSRSGNCGGASFSTFLTDLNKDSPKLKFASGEYDDGRKRVRGFPVRITESESEVATITAYATQGVHDFEFVIHWTGDGVSGETRVAGPDGKPFSVAAPADGAARYIYEQDGTFESNRFTLNPQDPLGGLVLIGAS